jgi:hypothetical protein
MTRSRIVVGALLLLVYPYAIADLADDAAAKMVKSSLKDVCEDDKDCLKAVDQQFDACLRKSDFKKYMDASPADEDKYLDSTFKYLYSCIVDADGDPLFTESE